MNPVTHPWWWRRAFYTKLACAWISHLFLTTALLDAFLDALLDAHSGDL